MLTLAEALDSKTKFELEKLLVRWMIEDLLIVSVAKLVSPSLKILLGILIKFSIFHIQIQSITIPKYLMVCAGSMTNCFNFITNLKC